MSSIKYRHLGRDSAHRKALLKNLVTALIDRETISTTYAKAKETQRMAEKLITLAKKNTEATRNRAQTFLFESHKHMPKLFSVLRSRYEHRPGGYTRLLLSEPLKGDTAPSAVLSLVDGPKDMRFAMVAKTLLHERRQGLASMPERTAVNVRKVTRFRPDGEEALEKEVVRLEGEEERVKRVERKQYESDGTTWEWVEDPGPGKVKKKEVKADELNVVPTAKKRNR